MSTTFTTLFQLKPREDDGITNNDLCTVKSVLLKEGFRSFDLTPTGGNYDVLAQFFQNCDASKSVLLRRQEKLVTLDFNEASKETRNHKHREVGQRIHGQLQSLLPQYNIQRIPPLQRGSGLWQYAELGDGRICENALVDILYERVSPYQRVTVADTRDYGHMLLLDGVENLSEEDDAYSRSVCGFTRKVDYTNKAVLILGGGDGGALNLLKELPVTMITLVEIDEVVLWACQKYLRGCCGSSLDQREGNNYQIIVADCVTYMEEQIRCNRKFDIIISDVTDVPIDPNKTSSTEEKTISHNNYCFSGEGWEFMQKIYALGLELLAPGGLLITHVTATSNRKGVELFKKVVQKLSSPLELDFFEEWVPSFSEKWTFCKMRKTARGELDDFTQPNGF